MARPRQLSDDDLLEHAREVFLEHGPAVSTTVVAEKCGMSQAALFKRFGTKKALLLRALLPNAKRLENLSLLAAGPPEGPIREPLIQVGVLMATFFREQVPAMATLCSTGFDRREFYEQHDTPPPVMLLKAMAAWFDACGDRIHSDLPREDLAMAFIGTLHVRAFFTFIGATNPHEDLELYVSRVVDAWLDGIGGSS